MRFAHLSDLHLSQTPVDGVLADADTIVTHLVHDVCRIREGLDFVVVSGDMTDDADATSFRRFEALFAQINLPVYIVPGNHDGPAGYRAYCSGSGQFSDWDITNRVVPLSGLRLLGIDTCIEGETTGRIDAEALRLVAQESARRDAGTLVVVMHHPPISPGMRDFDAVARLDGSGKMLGILQRADGRQIILSGHVHRPYQGFCHGAACFVTGSPTSAHTSELPFGASPIRFEGLQDYYHVHEVDDAGRHVVTPQHFQYAPQTFSHPERPET
ncbi:metallophosphoesterase family protein [Aliiruegeria lutimaris]|uniref:Calcineurin-like phosphoesterase n=1 Tax=Aliiruegeria lutimaris TaxID=571298 RepID=A0A1G9FEH4_9RHOB|nr:metallophosphoesterase [Aliiruegeria lutimaris]SDK86835.1 Calcineurin-like phosphoesterase [Aliiruegeria lutimaris]